MWAPLIISKVDKIHELQEQRDDKCAKFKRTQLMYKRLVENDYGIYVEVNYRRTNTSEERSDRVNFDIVASRPGAGENLKKALLADVQEELIKLDREINSIQDEINSICKELEANTPEWKETE